MKTKKILLILSFLFIPLTGFSQQIGSGFASDAIPSFNVELLSGFYQGNNATGQVDGGGWNHLLNLRHSNMANNHQLQIAGSYTENDRLFFRKFARELGNSNPDWHEIATREGNTFNGIQTINGDVYISKSGVIGGSISIINPAKTGASEASSWKIYNMSGSYGNSLQFWAYDNIGCASGGLCSPRMAILDNGNIGIGTTNPDEKLAVNGNIHAKEVRVDLVGWPDYVFQKYYTGKSDLKSDYVMPTLGEIENFTRKNHHLPNVSSAKEIQEKGLSLGEMSNILLQKVEELTLYAIEQQKELNRLKTENENYKSLAERLIAIEKELIKYNK